MLNALIGSLATRRTPLSHGNEARDLINHVEEQARLAQVAAAEPSKAAVEADALQRLRQRRHRRGGDLTATVRKSSYEPMCIREHGIMRKNDI